MTTSFQKIPFGNSLRFSLIAVFWLLISSLTGIASAETISEPPAAMEISFQENLISAELVDVPLIDVLRRLAGEFGFKAHFHGDLSEPITLSMTDLSLNKALRRLTANHSVSIVSDPSAKQLQQNETKQITEVWVLSRSSTSKRVNSTPPPTVIPAPNLPNDSSSFDEDPADQPENEEQQNIQLDQILDNPDAEKTSQRQAIQNLVEIGGPASVMAMAAYLGNEDKELRQLLVNGIGSVQNEQSTQVLGQVLQNESDPEIRKIALRALASRQDDAIAQIFLEEALDDTDEEIKSLADQLIAQ